MSENEPEKPRKGWGCLLWAVALGVLALLGSLSVPVYGLTTARALQMKAGSNARQIMGWLLMYAADHDGTYPDGSTANAAFRKLIQGELLPDESMFGCPYSAFVPDKQWGAAPDFKQALEPGENHWMLVAGRKNTDPSNYPIILENAVEATWPPCWLLPEADDAFSWRKKLRLPSPPPPPGRSWRDGTIAIARNDAAVNMVKLVEKDGQMHLPDYLFSLTPGTPDAPSTFQLLDVERKSAKK